MPTRQPRHENIVVLLSSASFVFIYTQFISEKSLSRAIQHAAVFGFAHAITFGYGSYSYMPIPYAMAHTWFLGTLAEAIAGGVVIGLLIKPEEA